MLKLKLQYFGHCWRANSLGKTLMLGKIESGRRRERQRMRWVGWHHQNSWTWVWANSRRWWGRPGQLQSMGLQRVGQDWVAEQQPRPTGLPWLHSLRVTAVWNADWLVTLTFGSFPWLLPTSKTFETGICNGWFQTSQWIQWVRAITFKVWKKRDRKTAGPSVCRYPKAVWSENISAV